MKFGYRLRELRMNENMTQKELAKRLSLSTSTIGMYEQNRRFPDAEILSKIALIFGVSVDFLIGKDDSDYINSKEYFYFFFDCWDECAKRIRLLLNENQLSEDEFCHELNIDLNEEITISSLIEIAEKLNVSTDYLLGKSKFRQTSEDDLSFLHSLSAREKNIIETFRLLNPDNQDIVVGELKKCFKDQRLESVAADKSLKQAK